MNYRSMEEILIAKWNYSFLYLIIILIFLFFLQAQFSPKLQLNHSRHFRLKKSPQLPLRFRSDGTFKILQVADMHYGTGILTRCRDVSPDEFDYCSDLNTTQFLRRMIEAEKPDFIAFTGDNIFGSSTADAAESLFRAFGPVMESGLPWAAVLGNHDQESTMSREELMTLTSLMDYSVSEINPMAKNGNRFNGSLMSDIDGFGNYDLPVYGAPGSPIANSSILNLYFLDSGDRETVDGRRTYGWIKESQLRWLQDVSKETKEAYLQGRNQDIHRRTDASPPALAFFHIPVYEVWQLYNQQIVGQFQEAVACSKVNSGALQTFVSMGDVKAVFIGHDHKNDFCGNLEGIWFCYGGGFGYHAYGKAGWPRRARVISAQLRKGDRTWEGVERIKTWKRLDDENLIKIDEQVLWEVQHQDD